MMAVTHAPPDFLDSRRQLEDSQNSFQKYFVYAQKKENPLAHLFNQI